MILVRWIEKYPKWSLTVFTLAMLLIQLDVPQVTIMEARNFITAREMVEDGNWVMTTMNGEPRYEKPPLPTWITALSGIGFGADSLFALRLPAALMVLLLGLGILKLSESLGLSRLQGFRNALVLVTSFYVFGIINEAPWDIYTHGFMLLALIFLWKTLQGRSATGFLWSILFLALSILSKGPVSLYALFLPFVFAYLVVYGGDRWFTKLPKLIMLLLLGTLIGSTWYLYVRFSDPHEFVAIAQRETGNWGSYNIRPFYYYWSFFVQSGIWTIPALMGLMFPYIRKHTEHHKAYKFMFWLTLIAVILLSVIPEKKSRYLMPVLIPLALTTGTYIDLLIRRLRDMEWKERVPVYVNFGLLALLALAIPLALWIRYPEVAKSNQVSSILLTLTGIAVAFTLIYALARKEALKLFYTTVGFMGLIMILGLPIGQAFVANPDHTGMKELKLMEQREGFKSFYYGEIAPEMVWDYGDKLPEIGALASGNTPKDRQFGLLVSKSEIREVMDQFESTHTLRIRYEFDLNHGNRKKERLRRTLLIMTKI
jgi:4-amino-4-deoxy-L-arabinose transferase-like glycosyltransferase